MLFVDRCPSVIGEQLQGTKMKSSKNKPTVDTDRKGGDTTVPPSAEAAELVAFTVTWPDMRRLNEQRQRRRRFTLDDSFTA